MLLKSMFLIPERGGPECRLGSRSCVGTSQAPAAWRNDEAYRPAIDDCVAEWRPAPSSARRAVGAGKLAEEPDAAHVAVELATLPAGANVTFVLHDDPLLLQTSTGRGPLDPHVLIAPRPSRRGPRWTTKGPERFLLRKSDGSSISDLWRLSPARRSGRDQDRHRLGENRVVLHGLGQLV